MERYLCIHGHFYQPPRENPWLESIEIQDSAYPYHDWNERIDAECYAPNAAARILDTSGLIDKIVCNYDQISFDFGRQTGLRLSPTIGARDVIMVVVIVIAIAVAASLQPAWKASKMDPITALKHV